MYFMIMRDKYVQIKLDIVMNLMFLLGLPISNRDRDLDSFEISRFHLDPVSMQSRLSRKISAHRDLSRILGMVLSRDREFLNSC